MKTLLSAFAAALILSACAARQQKSLADDVEGDAQLKLCILDHGVNPEGFVECLRQFPGDAQGATACFPLDKRNDIYRCMLVATARMQDSEQSTTCWTDALGVSHCTSN